MGRNRSSTFAFAAAYLVLVLGLFVALGGVAYAASSASNHECDESSSASDQYCEETTRVAGVKVSATAGGDTASAAATDADALPNTGLSLVGVVAIGGALVAAGVALRRRERRKS